MGTFVAITIWSVAAGLTGAAVSMTTLLVITWLWPRDFDWSRINERPKEAEANA